MENESMTTRDGLPLEIERCRKLLRRHEESGQVGESKAIVLRQSIARALKAVATW